jgi:hypothetical protein
MAEESPTSHARDLARQLGELEERIRDTTSVEVQITLLERATELAEEATRSLEDVGRERR